MNRRLIELEREFEELKKEKSSVCLNPNIASSNLICQQFNLRPSTLRSYAKRYPEIRKSHGKYILDSEITKTASRRIVKIPENLAKWLEPYVWELGTKKKILNKGKTTHINKLHESLGKGNWIKNGLRHSAATYYLALTKNAYLTAEQMGHAVDVLKHNYNGLARERDAVKYFEILPEE